jgi:rRNA biogenesis protein RRP5
LSSELFLDGGERLRIESGLHFPFPTMAPIIEKKRKNGPTNDSFVRSKKSAYEDDRPAKRLRPEEEQKSSTTKVPQGPKISKVRDGDAAFPRGGASILTPLEHKQIQIEATRDVLFEQQGAKAKRADADGDEAENAQPTKKKSKPKVKGKKGIDNTEPEEETVKIEGLSYRVWQGAA